MSRTSNRPAKPPTPSVVTSGGEMGERIRARDWSASPLGPIDQWPSSLRTMVAMLLEARHPMLLFWGPELIQFYNDGFRPSLGTERHPEALGQRARECWADAWPVVGAQIEAVVERGESTWNEDFLIPIDRDGRREEVYWTYGYSPVRSEDGRVAGVLVVVTETTAAVIGRRRLRTLANLATGTADAATADDVVNNAVRLLAENPNDVPFSLVYLSGADGGSARRAGLSGVDPASPAAPLSVMLEAGADTGWPIAEVLRTAESKRVDVSTRFDALPGGPWPEPCKEALVLPIARSGQGAPVGVLVAGLSPRRPLDADYRHFLELVTDRLATGMARARAFEEERRRAESLAELDRAKTAFFSNVSHEFRTPLTLLLGETEEALLSAGADEPALRGDGLRAVHRNSLRMLRLVNALLDFARIEAGRVRARYVPTALAEFTADLASTFRSAARLAGLELEVHARPLSQPVYVDRDMWEKIVLNLLSNALKFTKHGRIDVELAGSNAEVELIVSDTGAGIPADEVPHVFERFHRVQGREGRTHKGTGIGLALVRELVLLHGGDVSIESAVGQGTTVRVRIPTGSAHLPTDQVESTSAATAATPQAAPYSEDLLWQSLDEIDRVAMEGAADDADGSDAAPGGADGVEAQPATILLADDDGDMRRYVGRLLRQAGYRVRTAADGAAALASARKARPDLVLSDVMMPKLDGFELLRELRADTGTRDVPVLLLSARAGEESRVEGLEAGADDYLVKPFSARELIARVEAHLELARLRRETQARLTRLFMQAPVAVSVVTGPEFVYELANPRYLEMVGRTDIVGKTIREAFPELPPDAPVFGMLEQTYATGERFIAHEYPVLLDRSGDGTVEEVYFMFTCQTIEEATDDVRSLMTVAVDVTEQVRARRQVEEARRDAHDANRAKSAFLATMSHELRTPLNAIIGYSALLEAEIAGRLTEGQRTQLARIDVAARHLLEIIEEILSFSRIEAGHEKVHARRMDLALLAREMAALIEPSAHRKGLAFHCVAPDRLEIETDPGKVRQILLNLLSNAVRFTEEGEVRMAVAEDDHGAIVRVSDTGVGIAAESLEQIFEPFTQLQQEAGTRAGGTGLGLSVTRRLVVLLGGSTSVESEPGKGSVFEVRLPHRTPEGPAEAPDD